MFRNIWKCFFWKVGITLFKHLCCCLTTAAVPLRHEAKITLLIIARNQRGSLQYMGSKIAPWDDLRCRWLKPSLNILSQLISSGWMRKYPNVSQQITIWKNSDKNDKTDHSFSCVCLVRTYFTSHKAGETQQGANTKFWEQSPRLLRRFPRALQRMRCRWFWEFYQKVSRWININRLWHYWRRLAVIYWLKVSERCSICWQGVWSASHIKIAFDPNLWDCWRWKFRVLPCLRQIKVSMSVHFSEIVIYLNLTMILWQWRKRRRRGKLIGGKRIRNRKAETYEFVGSKENVE